MLINGLPVGFEAVEIRAPKENEFFLNEYGGVDVATHGNTLPRLILKAAPGYSVDIDVAACKATAVMVFEQPKSMRVNLLAFSDIQEAFVRRLVDAARQAGVTVSADF